MSINIDDIEDVFEERAEYLSKEQLQNWTEISEIDLGIIAKLKGSGGKLLSGPRGSGKSTLLRIAYFQLVDSPGIVPAYINYSQSLALEPLFHSHANALKLFRQWVLHKIIIGIADGIKLKELEQPDFFDELVDSSRDFICSVERGLEPANSARLVGPTETVRLIEQLLDNVGATRCVLLMDDAAHAFSPEQQREFFEIFRQLKSRKIASKAAIYPGITSFSHSFNVGHEAEVLEAWYKPDQATYLPLMRQIATKRLPESIRERFGSNLEEYIDVLALASFGQPRAFFVMLAHALEPLGSSKTITKNALLKAVAEYADYVRGVHRSIGTRLKLYSNFIELGRTLEVSIVQRIRLYNASRQRSTTSVMIGIQEPVPSVLEKSLQFLEYAGVARKWTSHSRGHRRFERYSLHYSILISENALGLGQTFKITDITGALRSPDQRYYYCATPNSLVTLVEQQQCRLALPACQKCGTERLTESQKFCTACGAELTEASIYKQLLGTSISELPLTRKKIDGILRHTKLRTVQDIVTDDTHSIKKVPYINKVWAQRIRTIAEEFLSV